MGGRLVRAGNVREGYKRAKRERARAKRERATCGLWLRDLAVRPD